MDYLEFTLNADQGICNALRRIMIADVPIYAIEVVSISKNNGIINDEMLAHRLGLLPLSSKVSANESLDDFYFTLDVSFDQDKADSNNVHTIYSGSLIGSSKDVSLVHNDIILAALAKGQSISLKAFIAKGTGFEHAKWSASCGTTYIDHEDGSITFKIETTGSLEPIELFQKSIDILDKKLDVLKVF